MGAPSTLSLHVGVIFTLVFALTAAQPAIPKIPVVDGGLSPPYFNLADNRRIYASATCGEDVSEPELYCKLVGSSASSSDASEDYNIIKGQICDFCDPSDPKRSHPASNAIDGTSNWWQSPPMSRGLKYAEVNLTIDLGQEFHVAYVFIKMGNSPRPGVWVLERSIDNGKTYKPWQYFADTVSDCIDLFGEETIRPITRDDSVTCETQFSKVVPLEDGEIVVSLLNNRPSSSSFYNSTVLQEWTKATNIRLRLLRPKTLLGQWTSFSRNDFTLTRRFFYSIRDISIGGRCVCNGHAESCDITDPEDNYKLLCRCRHNTCGPQCERCCPGFVQKAWKQSKAYDPFACEPCNCFGHSDECEYNPEIDHLGKSLDIHGNYEGGGVCLNCKHNTQGINCDQCKPGFFRPYDKPLNATDVCQPCECDVFYSTGNCAQGSGECECRPEFQPPFCDQCSFGYYGYPDCRPCDCHRNGTRDNVCEVGGGQCPCKYNYAGNNCDQCAEGFYNFPECLPCDCESPGSSSNVCDAETGQCVCDHNFGGRACERCEHGFFNFPTCSYCNCDPRGTIPEVCDKGTGQCLCKPGYGGPRCDQCQPGYYGHPDCKPCNCSDAGSASSVCTPNGKCPCLPNFSGRACDQCSPGYFRYPECLSCNCDTSGSLGVSCDDEGSCQCRSNFDGQRCDRCREGFYNYPACEDCNCDPAGVVEEFAGCGSVPKGELCKCKERVQGRICNKCKPLYWNMQINNPLGCEDCDCSSAGTVSSIRVCDSEDGQCTCKARVMSRRCSECADGFFNLQEDNPFGCTDCGCNIGGSISPLCDRVTGQCVCRQRVQGRACDEPLQLHYFPTLYQFQYEVEDGYTPTRSPVRFGFDQGQFPEYSWRGYAVFSQIQNEVLQDFLIEKPSLYRMILRYINPNDETVMAKVKLSPENPSDTEQTYLVRMEPTREPKLVTVAGPSGNLPTPFILNTGTWTASIATNKSLYLDYFVLMPAAYYEGTILQERVLRPCLLHEQHQGSCRQFTYASLNHFASAGSDASYTPEGNGASLIPDPRLSRDAAELSESQTELNFDVGVSQPGKYVLVLVYVTSGQGKRTYIEVDVESAEKDRRQEGVAILYDCTMRTSCRQVVTDSEGKIADFNFESETNHVVIRSASINEAPDAAIDSIVAIPTSEWSLDFVQPKSVCVQRDGKCVPGNYPTASDSTRVEFESGNVQATSNLPEEIYDENAGLVFLDRQEPMVDVTGKVPHAGYYVFIVHYYQPNHPQFEFDVLLQNGQFYEAKIQATLCPSNSGCRSVIKQANGNQNFQIQENFVLTLKSPANRTAWVDYVYVVPSDEFTSALLEESPIDLTAEFIARCGRNNYQVDRSTPDFCRQAIFALTTEFNSGALPCQCDFQGSLSFECDPFGGQCPCKAGVIGRTCNRCQTGYFGFPDCKPCDCPSTALCDPVSGSCICPPRVTGARCDQCVANTYGYDPIIGCEECNCDVQGVHQGNLQCDSFTGQCQCKHNVVGRNCSRCANGYWAFPFCQLCDCDVRGSAEEICDQENSECFCKENVVGPSCDECAAGTFNLQESNPSGCSKCFCFGKASACVSSRLFRSHVTDMKDWSGAAVVLGATGSRRTVDQVQSFDQTVRAVLTDFLPEDGIFYFSAPLPYLGNKLTSYGGNLNYSVVYVSGPAGYSVSAPDVIISGGDLTLYHFSHVQLSSSVPSTVTVEITERNFVLPSGLPASRENLLVALKDVRAIFIRGSYSDPTRETRLTSVTIDTAVPDYREDADVALAVEQCQCPPNYMGTSCEDCAPGYFRAQTGPHGGFCVPCQCHGHSDSCDPVTGKCFDCKHNTVGDHCEKCDVGYHGDATQGTMRDCMICACPLPVPSNNFALSCDVSSDETEFACQCKEGYIGPLCDYCAPGYYGQPAVEGDFCKPCSCSGNIDVNDPFACDSVTGQCLKCLNNTYGEACSLCAPGFFGDAIEFKDCQACHCDECGTSQCNSFTGDCECQPNVIGEKCDRCAPDHYGFNSCRGCRPCDCAEASEGTQCDDNTGQCRCRPGVAGRNCERCAAGFWNYTPAGCQSCNCNTEFSIGVGCNPLTGQCSCLPGVIGDKCEACPYRWVLIQDAGCFECDSCTHNLLDVTDEIKNRIDPVVTEYESVALTFFTHQKLASLNQSANDLRNEVVAVDISNIDFVSLDSKIIGLEAQSRSLKIRAGYADEEIQDKAKDAHLALTESAVVEKLIQEAVQKSHGIIGEVAALADSLEGGAGPQIDKALSEAQNILQEIKSRNFQQRQNGAEQELQEAINLLAKMREEALPVRDNNLLLVNLIARHQELIGRVDDLIENVKASQSNADMAAQLTAKNRDSSPLGFVQDIQQRNISASSHIATCEQILANATALMESARRAVDQFKADIDRIKTTKDNLKEAVELKEEGIADSRRLLYDAQVHAAKLADQATGLDELLADTRQTSENAVSAANSYKNIVDAIDEAMKAALEAQNAGENASQLTTGIGVRAVDSNQRSEELVNQAQEALVRTQTMLKPRLVAADTLANLVEENNQRTSEAIRAISVALDKAPPSNAKETGAKAVEISNAAQKVGSEASAKIQEISNEIPVQTDRTRQLSKDVDAVSKGTSSSMAQLERLNSVLPDLRDLLTRTKDKQAQLSQSGKDIAAKLAELRQKTALARQQANRITVGATFYSNSTLQLRNPEGLGQATTANTFSLYFRTSEPDGFLAYLGNEVGTSKKLRRTRSDDFMALEIRNGYLTLTTDLGSGPQSIVNDRFIADNVWYQAIVSRTGKSVRLTVRAEVEGGSEEVTVKETVLPGTFSVFNLDQELSKLYIGGYPSTAKIQPVVQFPSFQGEVEEVMVGDTPVGLWNFVDAANVYGAVERDKLKNLQQSTGYRFDGEGYATLDRRQYRFRDRVDVQLKFKTLAETGLLFLAGKGKEFMSIELSMGKVVYRYNLGDETVTLASPEKYNDDNWHLIEVGRQLRDSILKVDGEEVAQRTSSVGDSDLAVTNYMYFGGYPGQHRFTEVTNVDFDGCIDEVQISGTPVDLSQNIEAFGVLPACPAKVANVVSFNEPGSGYVALPGVNIENFAQVSLKFKTKQDNGLIFYMANEDQTNRFSLAMLDGSLVLRSSPGGDVSSEGPVRLNDGQWHVVTATADSSQISLVVDDFDVYTLDTPNSPLTIPATPIYFGGVPDTFALAPGASATDTSFSGCIGDTSINGKSINYASSTSNQGASTAKCPIPDGSATGAPAAKPKRIDDDEMSAPEPTPVEPQPPKPPKQEEVPQPPVTEAAPEKVPETTPTPTTTAATTIAPETTTAPMGRCNLPLRPADDPDVDENSGMRFGNVKFSRYEYSTLPGRHRQKSELSVEIKTTEPDGIIFYAAENRHIDYIALYLKGGKLHFSFNCGTGPALLVSPETYNDNEWHTVMFNRDRQNGTLVVDDVVVAEGSSPGNTQTINVDAPYYVGGISPEVLNNARHNFKGIEGGLIGCLRNFRASSRPVGDPTHTEGTEPCSSKVESGSFFAADGGYIKAVENFRVGLDIDISMEIKPRSTSGILMSVHGRRDHLILQLVDGELIFSVDNGRGPILAKYTPPHDHHLCDGKWHYIQAIKAKNVVTLSVDNVFVEPGIGTAGVSSTDTNHPLYIGGHPNPTKPRGFRTHEPYIGCIRNININRKLLRFGSAQAVGSVTATTCPTI